MVSVWLLGKVSGMCKECRCKRLCVCGKKQD